MCRTPKDLILRLRDKYQLKYFVETGTLHGRTTAWVAPRFKEVYTIELSERHHNKTKKKHRGLLNVHWILGNSGEVLGDVLACLGAPALLWIDAHWSPDLGYVMPEFGECPIMREIEAINDDGRPHVILIDDARHFVGRPPRPQHDEKWWPVYKELEEALLNHSLSLEGDVIVGLPK